MEQGAQSLKGVGRGSANRERPLERRDGSDAVATSREQQSTQVVEAGLVGMPVERGVERVERARHVSRPSQLEGAVIPLGPRSAKQLAAKSLGRGILLAGVASYTCMPVMHPGHEHAP